MGYRIGDVEPPLDPPEAKYFGTCDSCGEGIPYGADVVKIEYFKALLHDECETEYLEKQLGIEYFEAEDLVQD